MKVIRKENELSKIRTGSTSSHLLSRARKRTSKNLPEINQLTTYGHSDITFVIGGSLVESGRAQAGGYPDFVWSLYPATS